MKYVGISLMFFLFVGASCKKKSSGASPVVPPPAVKMDSLSAVINSIPWLTYTATSNLIPSSIDSGANNLQISGSTTIGNVVSNMVIFVNNYTGPANLAVNPPAVSITYYVGSVRHYATSGSLTITSDSSSFTGNFTFTADSVNAVSGVFAIPR